MRINRYIAACGICSRREADKIISEGRVTVNGKVAEKNTIVKDQMVMVDGKKINMEEKIYIALNKPAKYLTATKDNEKKTVMDLININKRVFPLGRLDYDTEGLLILTNDSELFEKMMHPDAKMEKKYYVELDKELNENDKKEIERGMYLKSLGYRTKPCKIIQDHGLFISITEGKKRQIRRLFLALGYKVKYLKRVSIGNIKLGDLAVGKYRYLTKVEERYLKEL